MSLDKLVAEFDRQWPVRRHAINPHPLAPPCYGADTEPAATQWMSILCAAAGSKFGTDMVMLDYGCGAGRLVNFVSERVKNFTYFGVEPKKAGPFQRNRSTNLDICRFNYGGDHRVIFGAIGGNEERQALNACTVIVAGSVFTHLAYEQYVAALQKFRPALKRGARFVHSLLVGAEYGLHGGHKMHETQGCWQAVTYTPEQVAAAAEGFKVDCLGSWHSAPNKLDHEHRIMVMHL